MSQLKQLLLLTIITLLFSCGNQNVKDAKLTGPNAEELRTSAQKAQRHEDSPAWLDLAKGDKDGVTLLMALIPHENNDIAREAFRFLKEKKEFPGEAIPFALEALTFPEREYRYDLREDERAFMVHVLAGMGDEAVSAILESKINEQDNFSGVLARIALAGAGHEEVVPTILENMADSQTVTEYGTLAMDVICTAGVSESTSKLLITELNSYLDRGEYHTPQKEMIWALLKNLPKLSSDIETVAPILVKANKMRGDYSDYSDWLMVQYGKPMAEWLVKNDPELCLKKAKQLSHLKENASPLVPLIKDTVQIGKYKSWGDLFVLADSIGEPAGELFPILQEQLDTLWEDRYCNEKYLGQVISAMISVDSAAAVKDLITRKHSKTYTRDRHREALMNAYARFGPSVNGVTKWIVGELGSKKNNMDIKFLQNLQEVALTTAPKDKDIQKAVINSLLGYRRFVKNADKLHSKTIAVKRELYYSMSSSERSNIRKNIELANKIQNNPGALGDVFSMSAAELDSLRDFLSSAGSMEILQGSTFIRFIENYGMDRVRYRYETLLSMGRETETACRELLLSDAFWEAKQIALELLINMDSLESSTINSVKKLFNNSDGYVTVLSAACLLKNGIDTEKTKPVVTAALDLNDPFMIIYALKGLVNEKLTPMQITTVEAYRESRHYEVSKVAKLVNL